MRYFRVSLYSLFFTILLGAGSMAHAQECFIGEVRWWKFCAARLGHPGGTTPSC